MHIITVAPLSRSRGISTLTYYSTTDKTVGAIVDAPIKKRTVPAIVLSSTPLAGSKSMLRHATYTLQKLPKKESAACIPEAVITACARTADEQALSVTAALYSLLPKSLIEFFATHTVSATQKHSTQNAHPKIFQDLFPARISLYRTLIREAFAHKQSVVIVTPYPQHALRSIKTLGDDCTKHYHILHGEMSPKKQTDALAAIHAAPHPIAAIVTPRFAALPRNDIAQYILEHEHSELYRTHTTPQIDLRSYIAHLAAAQHADLLYADLPLSITRIRERQKEVVDEITTGNQRITFPVHTTLIDQKGQKRAPKESFATLSPHLRKEIPAYIRNGKRALLYVARRGISSTTVCNDCGTTVTCNICGASVVLHKAAPDNYFLCHSCGVHRTALERCKHCDSWRLEALGVGAERVEEELRGICGDTPVFIATSDSNKTPAQTRKTIEQFENTSGSILISTLPAIRKLSQEVPFVGVVSMDTLFSIPAWNMQEHIARTLMLLANVASEQLTIQTRHPNNALLETLLSGNISRFYREELAMRKKYGYPPYTTLIKVTTESTPEHMEARAQGIRTHLQEYAPVSLPHTMVTPKGLHATHCFLRISAEQWPETHLVELLRNLPPYARVTINPDTIL